MKNINAITTAVFLNNSKTAMAVTVWQYDYGMKLRLQGLQLPAAVEIHFSAQETRGEAITRVGTTQDGVTDVTIPDSLLENDDATRNYLVYAFVYLTDETSGQTEYKVTIPVNSRPRPNGRNKPDETELFRQAIDAVNTAADRAEAAGTMAQSWATGGTGTRDGEDTDNAKHYAQQAKKAVDDAAEAFKGSTEQIETNKTDITALREDLDDVVDGLQMYHINDFNKKDVTLDSYLGRSVGKSSMYDAPVSSESGFVCNKIYKITQGDVIYTNNGSVIPYLYDSNGLFLERLTDESIKDKTVENEQARYMKWQYGSKNALDTIMINVGHPLPDDYVGYDAVSITTKETKEIEERVYILENQEVANESKCYVLLSFDDQTQMYADRFPIMKEYGFPFTFCLNSSFQDNNGFANDSEKQTFFEMLSYGCDVAQYHIGRNITGIGSDSTAEEWQNAISNLLDFINGYGIYPVTCFARQNVLYDNAITALKNLGFGIARSGMYSPENNYRWIESYDDERFNTPCYPVNATNLENCKKYLDDCVKNGWSIAFMTHRLTGADDNNCDETTFRTLMNYIKNYTNQGKCEVVTYQNFLNYKTKKGKEIENLRKEKRLNWVQSKIN